MAHAEYHEFDKGCRKVIAAIDLAKKTYAADPNLVAWLIETRKRLDAIMQKVALQLAPDQTKLSDPGLMRPLHLAISNLLEEVHEHCRRAKVSPS